MRCAFIHTVEQVGESQQGFSHIFSSDLKSCLFSAGPRKDCLSWPTNNNNCEALCVQLTSFEASEVMLANRWKLMSFIEPL